jgi:hypothetical protein
LLSANAPDFWTKAGLMIRADLTAGSPNDIMLDTPNPMHQEPVQQWRDNWGQTSGDTGNHGTSTTPNVPTPMWLRLNRTGNVFTGYYAVDNNGAPGPWQLLMNEPHTTVMPTTVLVGLALNAHNNGATATAIFDHVTVTGNTNTPLPPVVARLTDGGGGEAGSIFTTSRVAIAPAFTTTFTLRDRPVNGAADSLSFVIQNDPRGAAALGNSGGDGGYGGITNSIAVKFDLYNHGNHNPSTGLFFNGESPAGDPTKDVPLTGINLGSGDPLQITLAYNGTTLTETVRDTVTSATFTHDYLVNIPQTIGSSTAYVGFTGGTGGETSVQDVLAWTGQFPSTQPAPAYLSATGSPSTVTAGMAFPVTITALDPGGHRIAYTGTVHFASSDPQAVLPPNYTFTAADNGQHTFMVTLKTAGNQGVFITDTANPLLAGFVGVAVNPAAASALQVAGLPSAVVSGDIGGFTVIAKDPYGNVATGYRGTVHFTSSDPNADLPPDYTFTAADAGSHGFGAELYTVGPDTLTATDTGTTGLSVTQSVVVTPASFTVSGPSEVTAGQAGSYAVTAYDALGNVATGYRGTVHLTSSDPQAVLPPDQAFTAADAGMHTFSATLKTAGYQSVTAQDTLTPGRSNGTAVVLVDPVAATTLSVSGFPSPTPAGTGAFVLVQALDPYGNVATGYTGTVHLSSTDPQAYLDPDYTYTAADAGQHYFVVFLYTAGTQSITATDTANPMFHGTQSGIVITPAAAASLTVTGPSEVTAGQAGTWTATAYDPYGNVATGYTGTVGLSSSDPQATLPGNYTFTTADAGSHNFSVTLKTAGYQSVTATDTANPSLTAAAFTLVDPAAATTLSVSGFPSPAPAGTGAFVLVQALDPYGNVATGYTGTVHLTSTDPQAYLDPDYTYTAADAGQHYFVVYLYTAGTQSITATDTANPGITGTQGGIVVTPAAAPGAGGGPLGGVVVSAAGSTALTGGSSLTAGGGRTTARTAEGAGSAATGYTGQPLVPVDHVFGAGSGRDSFSAVLNTPAGPWVDALDALMARLRGRQEGATV